MNKYKFLLTIFLLTCAFFALGQTGARLILSNQTPQAGSYISFRYYPAGTILQDKVIKASVYFFDNDRYPVSDVDLSIDGKCLEGSFKIPDRAMAFSIKLSDGSSLDDNNQRGYVYLVYRKHLPAPGAFANKAYIAGLAADMFGIKKNMESAATLYKKEFAKNPSLERNYESLYLLTLYYSSATDQDLANRTATALSKSAHEDDITNAYNYYKHARKTKRADSLARIIRLKFPKGKLVKNELEADFAGSTDLARKDSLYRVLSSIYFSQDHKVSTEADGLLAQLAISYLRAYRLREFELNLSKIKDKVNVPQLINEVLSDWVKDGSRLDDAELLAKRNLKLLDSLQDHPRSEMFLSHHMQRDINRNLYFGCLDTYALILFRQNKWEIALNYESQVYAYDHDAPGLEITEHYAMMLNKLGKYAVAKEVIERMIKTGFVDAALTDELKIAFTRISGGEIGYDQYLDNLLHFAENEKIKALSKNLIDIPAPDFGLKDENGKLVNLSDLKGKIVILDFWATWCAPCKASFPGLQATINKYKDNNSIVFLFIDTWETGKNYVREASKFMKENGYTVRLLFDEKGADGRLSKMRNLYGVDSVPTKLIIDKKGNIRFKAVGFNGSSEELVDELSGMISFLDKSI